MQGLSIANNLLSNQVQYNLSKNQEALQNTVTQLSSGLRINSAADDPSGLAIATNLQTQVDAFQQASQNVQDANNAAQVADGALQTETDILQRMRNLATEAASDVNSSSDKQNLQAEMSQLITEVNRISQNTNFNGSPLLDGSHSGYVAAVNGTATVSSNAVLAGSGNLVSAVGNSVGAAATFTTSYANGGALDGTIELDVVNVNGTAQVNATFYESDKQGTITGTSLTATAASGAAFTLDNVMVTVGAITLADVGQTAYVKVSQYVPVQTPSGSGPFTVQSGADEGDTVQIGIQATNAQTLRVSNVDISTTLGAEDAIGQISNALDNLLQQRAQIGAVIVRLNEDANNDNVASVNLQASESAIRDLNVGQATTEFTKLQVLVQVGTSVLAQSNANAQSVLGLFR
jgi:flagellin